MRIKHGLYGVLVIADTRNRKCQEILKLKVKCEDGKTGIKFSINVFTSAS